jgi:hypothetical protein
VGGCHHPQNALRTNELKTGNGDIMAHKIKVDIVLDPDQIGQELFDQLMAVLDTMGVEHQGLVVDWNIQCTLTQEV